MNGWEFLAAAGWMLVAVWGIVVALMLGMFAHDLIQGRIIRRWRAAKGWQEGYEQGVADERKAAEWDVPEYRIPRRQNPYGDPARFEGAADAQQPLQAARRTQLPE